MRIIAGEFRGRRIECPAGGGTRPTPDRVRGAVFNILREEVEGARVVELFGGTGALGLEALSRGAAHATFCEIARPALACLNRNVESLGAGARATVLRRSAFDLPRASRDGPPFDIVFCDPPHRLFEEAESRTRLAALLGALPLSPSATVIVEHRARALGDFHPPGLVLDDLREWGSVAMAFYRPAPAGTA